MGVKAQDETEVGNVRMCERASRINRTDSTVISVRDEKSVRVVKNILLLAVMLAPSTTTTSSTSQNNSAYYRST